ncbi:CMP/dCMP deaminase zinc-binding protein [Cryptococcus wingfieldii CBS 7118]|uniref:CMP/dCMP deaminase zinc-binding protein n=1 Tax=Cryptococcus wingfieldii CBS 7118 TaxID=1295528 RepID=A0A1E3JP27_9TREE|nr:CMP/dCMP deaminase zinc-binding protein [Cryptococcus wingfieldii CBS 7118]ODO01887.1 CMP/dCMP deaminase zinc-binding protein [Cryptococcus wingfieldii CBS 7118]
MSSHPPQTLLKALLKTTTDDIIPLTAPAVAAGCKVFGAAVLRRDDLSLVIAGTNQETESPLLHGEISCIQNFYALPKAKRPDAKDCVFFATHEPCSLCLSGITWSGFDNIHFLFTYEDTRDAFSIPHDIKILEEVFRVPSLSPHEDSSQLAQRPLYNKTNHFFSAFSIADLIADVPQGERAEWEAKVKAVRDQYNALSSVYQEGKGGDGIPLA